MRIEDKISTMILDEKYAKMMEYIEMEEVLIRNKQDALKLSKHTLASLEDSRRQRLLEAIQDNDKLYLKSVYESWSIWDIIKLLFRKTKRVYKEVFTFEKKLRRFKREK